MSWIDKIRNKPQHEKIRIIWAGMIITGIVLIILWILTARFTRSLPKDATLFKTIGQGMRDIRDNYRK